MNKYSFLSKVPPDMVLGGRSIIMQVYPETKSLYEAWDSHKGCTGCAKSSASRAILMLILETPKGTRDVSKLKKVLPADMVAIL
jgi:hypothetical protein